MASDRVMISRSKIKNVADAIREKTGDVGSYELDDMPEAIRSIETGGGIGATVTVTTETEDFYGLPVTLTDGTDSMTATFSNEGVAVFNGVEMEGELTVSVEYEGESIETAVTVISHYDAQLDLIPEVYGVQWAGTSTQILTRTDSAAGLSDPVAAVNGGDGSSPFDTIYPWSEMNIVEDAECGTMVKIPKFYFKCTKENGVISLKISKQKLSGFYTCPICADRGDGRGERDYALVGRYLCASNTYKSTTNTYPQLDLQRSEFRAAIHNLGANVWQYDLMAHFTIQMLYLVEYANWNSQATIGRGYAGAYNYSVPRNVGRTDSMIYHTGCMSGRDLMDNLQYRHIEGLWANAQFWVDGVYMHGYNGNFMIIKNPSDFGDTGGIDSGISVQIVETTDGEFIKDMAVSSAVGVEEYMLPCSTHAEGTYDERKNKYIGDWIILPPVMPVETRALRVGINGNAVDSSQGNAGLFAMRFINNPTGTNEKVGGRAMKLP